MKGMHVYLNLDDLQQFGQGQKVYLYHSTCTTQVLSRKKIYFFQKSQYNRDDPYVLPCLTQNFDYLEF
jgi:hypothetical protein